MVSPDGQRLFQPFSSGDTARGAPNLVFLLTDRKNRTLERRVIQDLPEIEQPSDAELAAREARAAAWLDRLAAAGFSAAPFVTIVSPQLADDDPSIDRHLAKLVVAGEPTPRLTVELEPDGTLIVRPRGTSPIRRHDHAWRMVQTPAEQKRGAQEWEAGRVSCFNAGYLAGADVDLRDRIAIVSIAYRGNDTCWEGDPARVVVAW